jgi:hypothetical protein
MSENLSHLEHEVERQLAELGVALSVEPAPVVIERVQAAARHALNEAWLASHPAPAPDAEALARVRAAVHRELARPAGDPARFARRSWRLAWPAVAVGAAAALIVISVGVIRYAGSSRPAAPAATGEADQTADLFVQAADRVWAEDPLIATLRIDLDTIEESLMRSQTAPDDVEEILEDIDSRIDELFVEPDGFERTSGIHRVQPGAIG